MFRPTRIPFWLLILPLMFCAGCDDGAVQGDTDAGQDAQVDQDGDAGEQPDQDHDAGPGDDGGAAQDDDDTPADPGPVECNDGIDNDGDGLVDWQLDLGCYGPADPTEGGLNNQLDNGWTVFEPAADTTVVYVSNSAGDDSWSGLAPDWDGSDGPKQTIAGGLALLQDGRPDWLLFRRGDVWTNEIIGNLKTSGRSEAEPLIIGTYGNSTVRPLFEVSTTWMLPGGGGGASEHRSHVRVLGVHVRMVTKDPDDPRFTSQGGSCLQWLRDGGDVLIEDIRCDYAQLNLQSDPILPFTVRRNVLSGSYSVNSHAQCLFTNIGVEMLIEENLLYRGGWNDVFRLALWEPEGDPAVWAQISDGRFGIELSGTHYHIDGVDFTGVTSRPEVAALLEAAINQAAGPDTVQVLFTQGGAFQIRAESLPSGPAYRITPYGGAQAGTDLDGLFNLGSQGSPESTIFNRNMYLAYGEGLTTVRGNIDVDGASGGLQLRMGGVAEDNLFINDPFSVSFGHGQNPSDSYTGGVIRNNVTLGSRDIDTQVQGSGLVASSNAQSTHGGFALIRDLEIAGNIVAHNVHGTGNFRGISLQGDGVFENVNVHDNIVYNWARPQWPDPQDQRAHCIRLYAVGASTGVEVHHNIFQQPNGGFLAMSNNDAAGVSLHHNTYWSTAPDPPDVWSRGWFSLGGSVSMAEWLSTTGETDSVAEQVQFLDPDRTIETYMASLGLEPALEAFLAEAHAQSRFNWRDEFTARAVNAYIREGFQRVK